MTDWESLSEQLKKLGVSLGKEKSFKSSQKASFPIERVVSGRFKDVIFGETFVHEEIYQKDYVHGEKPLHPTTPIRVLCEWADASHLSIEHLENLVFLDTETSGLAGGTGTYAFEVGLGRFTPEGFHLAQFFMRHPGEEDALLAGLIEFMDGMEAVVTYNGKSFDIPLLNTRYTMMGMTTPFENIAHFDLLHLARRLWRMRLESRTLGSIETNILGLRRSEEEVPGYMIPEMYFEYLKTKDARPMAGIFYHNAVDILSLTGLFSHMAFLLHDPFSEKIYHPEDIISLARFFESVDRTKTAQRLYEKSLTLDLKSSHQLETLEKLSFLHKRCGQWDSAIRCWEEASQAGEIYAFEELAKYYEHHAKDLNKAQTWTLAGIDCLQQQHFPAYVYQTWQAEFQHRLKRLQRRLASHTSDNSE